MYHCSAGLYYHISKRAAGIRYLFIGKQVNQRPRTRLSKNDHWSIKTIFLVFYILLPEKDLNVKSETLPLLAILSPLARDSPSISNPNELAASWPCPKGKMEFKDVMKRKEKVTDMNENMDTEETIHPNVKVVSLVTGKWKENRLMQQAESANVCFALAIANTQQPHLVVMFFAELATANRNTGGGWVQIY
ncbi:hypothetical protein RHMOL_Rhmol03G0039400 [Rhododendron molle]|uniref:Uncharacterized protein n=1 Tax=Rhododendron molle TaxID=49168 RepID=A0ACC0PBD5_RHOML|nr:hypothetical protein RHMOL_Rhmol03G0039400 [Rhododendron molle]